MPEATVRVGRAPEIAKYEILEEIGHGGMATVYRARDPRLARDVALKVIHPHLRDSREVVSRFNVEARAVAKLRHRNIVEVYDVSDAEDLEQYLVCELVRGTTLRRMLEKRSVLPPEIAASIGLELLSALAHAHAAGVVHRDIKPENVLIEQAPEGEDAVAGQERPSSGSRARVKLTDFGIAKLLDAQGVTSTGQVLGSPAHMAPEQIEGGEVDARSDIFGLGVLLYECMVGHLPFEGSNPAQVLKRVLDGTYPEAAAERAAVGQSWSKLLDRALAHRPADRFSDAGSMKEALLAELQRLGLPNPERELDSWLADSDAYEEESDRAIIDRLCALARDERQRGDVLSAAADWNRALAYAPNDPQLLRFVAGMHRAERNARYGKLALVAAGILSIAALGARGLRGKGHRGSPASTRAPALVSALPSLEATVPPVRSPAILAAPSGGPDPAVRSVPSVPRAAPAPVRAERTFTLDLKPPMGVAMSVDGQPPRDVSTGDKVNLDPKPHWLTFSCSRSGNDDPCISVRLTVPGGEKDDTLVVTVPVKPATLIVEGDAAKTYEVAQHPELAVHAGTNTLPLKSAYDRVTVTEIETGSSMPVRLEAGRTVHVSFR
jgi:eukaryotic-like serine/threonine-protein kinase